MDQFRQAVHFEASLVAYCVEVVYVLGLILFSRSYGLEIMSSRFPVLLECCFSKYALIIFGIGLVSAVYL